MSVQNIFFSYSRKDSEFALDLAKKLRNAGAQVWLDQLDIEPGTTWDDSIEDALQAADVLLVILSKTSVNSKNVRDEYSYAIEEEKRVVPVLLEACTVPFRLRRLQYADFSTDQETGIQTLIETLRLDTSIAERLSEIESPLQSKAGIDPIIAKTAKKYNKLKLLNPFLLIGFLLVIVLAFWITSLRNGKENNESLQLTVLVHDMVGKDQLILPNRGQVKLIYGDANVVETINAKGEATFKQIPANFFKEDAKVEILFIDPQGEPYRALNADSSYVLTSGNYIALPVKLYGLEEIRGIVKHFVTGDPIADVRISISGVESFSNDFGEYFLKIPPEQQRKFQTIRAYKEGFNVYEESNVPIQTDQEIPIVLKPKQTP